MAYFPAAVDLPLRRNADFVEEYQFTDATGALIDLTGYSAKVQIRLYGAQPGAPLIGLTTVAIDGSGVRQMDATSWRLWIGESAINDLPAGEPGEPVKLVWDWRFTDPTGVSSVWMAGAAIVDPGVTK